MQRYITQELKEYEEKDLGAEEQDSDSETKLYNELVCELVEFIPRHPDQCHTDSTSGLPAVVCQRGSRQTNTSVRNVVDDDVLDIRQDVIWLLETIGPPGEKYTPTMCISTREEQQPLLSPTEQGR